MDAGEAERDVCVRAAVGLHQAAACLQVIDTVFQELEAVGGDAQSLQTVSLVQVCAPDKAWDLLRPDGRVLQVMEIMPLGLMVEEAMEIAAPDAQAAISVYAWGLGAIPALQPPADGRFAMQGTSSLFTLTVERELEGGRLQRSALRILASPGAPRPCPEPYVPELRLCAGAERGPLSSTPVVPAVGMGGDSVPEVKQERPRYPNGSPWLGAAPQGCGLAPSMANPSSGSHGSGLSLPGRVGPIPTPLPGCLSPHMQGTGCRPSPT
ncbi:uncharacterized protein LJ206_015812 [Theristicus caerulescens]